MQTVSFPELVDVLRSLKGKKIAITFHSIGDTDSVASAFALYSYIGSAAVVAPDKITYNAASALSKCGFDPSLITNSLPDGLESIVLVDVNNLEDCGRLGSSIKALGLRVIAIDHHAASKIDAVNATVFNDERYNSTSSIVYSSLKELGVNIDASLAKLLAMGIISDSAEFKNSTALTFTQLGELFGIAGTDYISMVYEFIHTADASVRAGTLRDLFSSNVEARNGLVIISGSTANRASAAADDAIKVGADLAVFVSEDRDEVKLSARLRPTLDKEYGVHLGIIMKRVGVLVGGSGGGHPCAAGAYGPRKEAKAKAVQLIVDEVAEAARSRR